MNKRSTFSKARYRESQAVELRYKPKKEWTWEGERTRNFASVAIDGYRARNSAKRMIVRKKRTLKKSIWVAPRYSYIVPKAEHIPFSGFFAYKD